MDSGSEDEMQMAPAQTSTRRVAKENAEPATKKAVDQAKASSSTAKPSKTTNSKSKSTAQEDNSKKTKRKALQDISNEVNGSDMDEGNNVNDVEDDLSGAQPQNKANDQKKTKGQRTKERAEEPKEIAETQPKSTVASRAAASKKEGKSAQKQPPQDEIPETQPMDLDDEDDHEQHHESKTSLPSEAGAKGRNKTTNARASGTVEDLTKKLETLQARFDELRDVGVVEAESQVEKIQRLRRKEKQDAEAYISSLKDELAAQKSRASEDKALRKQIADLTSQVEAERNEKKAGSQNLASAQTEIKSLQAKLSAARSHSSENGGKGAQNGGPARTILVGSEEAKREMHTRALKEDLYADLSGLIMRDVKRRDAGNGSPAENIFDCLQTGRNGALHFRLSVPDSQAGPGQNATSYDEEEFTYTPMLDEKRDRDLIAMLPDYLTEEICFPRNNAAKFYARVADCLTKKVQEEIEDEAEKGEDAPES